MLICGLVSQLIGIIEQNGAIFIALGQNNMPKSNYPIGDGVAEAVILRVTA